MTADEANEYPVPLPATHSLSSRLRRAPARQSWPGAGSARIRPGCRISSDNPALVATTEASSAQHAP
jgi:hypothetical protein